MSFMSGITMSPEEAAREAEERERAAVAAAAAIAAAAVAAAAAAAAAATLEPEQETAKGKERAGSWSGSLRRRSITAQIPPVPSYQPPPPPPSRVALAYSNPDAEAVARRAEYEVQKSPQSEENIPAKTLKTTSAPAAVASPSPSTPNSMKHSPQTIPYIDRRESASQTVLPVVDEAGGRLVDRESQPKQPIQRSNRGERRAAADASERWRGARSRVRKPNPITREPKRRRQPTHAAEVRLLEAGKRG